MDYSFIFYSFFKDILKSFFLPWYIILKFSTIFYIPSKSKTNKEWSWTPKLIYCIHQYLAHYEHTGLCCQISVILLEYTSKMTRIYFFFFVQGSTVSTRTNVQVQKIYVQWAIVKWKTVSLISYPLISSHPQLNHEKKLAVDPYSSWNSKSFRNSEASYQLHFISLWENISVWYLIVTFSVASMMLQAAILYPTQQRDSCT